MLRAGSPLALALLLVSSACSPAPSDPGPTPSPAHAQDARTTVSASRPNIILIIGDDVGYPYHGFMGDPIVETPNLDRLAEGGTVFTTGYVTASVCEPSLYSLLTGREAMPRHGQGPRRRVSGTDSIAGLLGEQGYATLQSGKFWHGTFKTAGFSHGTKPTNASKTNPTKAWMGGEEGLRLGRSTMRPIFDFIDAHRDQPFFIWFAPMLPHKPWDAPQALRRLYQRRDPQLPRDTVRYFANITRLDAAVGDLVRYIDTNGLRENTLIIYVSDNGFGPLSSEDSPVAAWTAAKGTSTELGFRTPVVFNWPGHIPAGVVREDPVSTLDLFPTILAYGGAKAPEDRPGVDLRPALQGLPTDRRDVIGRMRSVRLIDPRQPAPEKPTPAAYYLRDDRWHYVWSPEANSELLFDVDADPGEQTNLAAELPQVTAELRSRVERWRDAG